MAKHVVENFPPVSHGRIKKIEVTHGRVTITPYQKKWNKAYKRLCGLNYTPQTANRLSSILCAMALEPGVQTEARLRAFGEIARDGIKGSTELLVGGHNHTTNQEKRDEK